MADQECPYQPLHDGDDNTRLNQLGYKQELRRGLSAVSNFSVTFSIISVLTGLTTTYNTGLRYGGTVTMVYGWPIVGAMTLVVGLPLAEICSAYPTSGGLYFWSAKLCGRRWGPFASWLTGWYVFGFTFPFLVLFLRLSFSFAIGAQCFITVYLRNTIFLTC